MPHRAWVATAALLLAVVTATCAPSDPARREPDAEQRIAAVMGEGVER